jgi:uncharacterized protein
MQPMTQPAKTQEPSMDEILASIRRMIGHDEGAKTASAAEPAPPAEAAAAPSAKVTATQPFSSTQPARAGAAGASALSRANGRDDNTGAPFGKREVAPGAEPLAPPLRSAAEEPGVDKTPGAESPGAAPAIAAGPAPRSSEPVEQPPLLSPAAAEAVDAALVALAHSVAAQRPRTLEDLASDLLRPMLKTWLDDNLPQMVERLVRAEIERVSRGR